MYEQIIKELVDYVITNFDYSELSSGFWAYCFRRIGIKWED